MSSGDYSRQRFDPTKNYTGVLMQQGRVQLDSDWNEMVAIVDRRLRALARDTMGGCVVPSEHSFEIKLAAATEAQPAHFTIGGGRVYVDGLLAENHGPGQRQEINLAPSKDRSRHCVRYDSQPYLAASNPLPSSPFLFYVDVWQREITCLQDPTLAEIALGEGADTTARLQTIWQVKRLEIEQTGDNDPEEDPAWVELIKPSTARLSTAGKYEAADNRLYRIEVHKPGRSGEATFKWSRDNGSISTKVESIEGTILTVQRVEWDQFRRFSENQWVELTDDWRELDEAPGLLVKIKTVDEASRAIELDVGKEQIDGFAVDDESRVPRYTRIRRWDCEGEKSIPRDGSLVALEHGVEVKFDVSPEKSYQAGQYWVFAVRADGSIERLDKAPPRGPHHHYGCLALVTTDARVVNLRKFWPRPPEITVEAKDKSVEHIQNRIDEVIREGGGTVSLGPGTYALEVPLTIKGATKSFRLRGAGPDTVLYPLRSNAAIIVRDSGHVQIEGLVICTDRQASEAGLPRVRGQTGSTEPALAPKASNGGTESEKQISAAIELSNSSRITIKGCDFYLRSVTSLKANSWQVAVGVAGSIKRVTIRECQFAGESGIKTLTAARENKAGAVPLVLESLLIEGNSFRCGQPYHNDVGPGLLTFSFLNNECLYDPQIAAKSVNVVARIGNGGLVALSGNLVQGSIHLQYNQRWKNIFKGGRVQLKAGIRNKLFHPLWHNLNMLSKR